MFGRSWVGFRSGTQIFLCPIFVSHRLTHLLRVTIMLCKGFIHLSSMNIVSDYILISARFQNISTLHHLCDPCHSTLVPEVFLDISPHERAAREPRSSHFHADASCQTRQFDNSKRDQWELSNHVFISR